MKIIQTENYQDMSNHAANMILDRVKTANNITLGLATGGTPPKKLYDLLVKEYNDRSVSYRHVTSFNLDEYIGLAKENKNSYYYYMYNYFFQYIDIPKEQIYLPDGLHDNPSVACQQYDQSILKNGGIDVQLLGLGENGHIGFNEPGSSFDEKTHIVELADSTREANARFFDDITEVPTKAITMGGISTIMKSKEIIMLVSGENKKEAFSTFYRLMLLTIFLHLF